MEAGLAKVSHLAYKNATHIPGPHPLDFEAATVEDT